MIARIHSLQVRFLLSLVLSVATALITVAVMSRWSTTLQFETYVQQNRDEMQQVAKKVALDTGQRVVAANAAGRVFLDSSNELLGTTLDPATIDANGPYVAQAERVMVITNGKDAGLDSLPPPGAPAPIDVPYGQALVGAPPMGGVAFNVAPPGPQGPFPDPEQLFLSSFNRSLLVGVLVGGVVALILAFAFSRGIVRSVEALTLAARRMADGHLDQRVVVRSSDEIGELGRAFNAMAEGLTRTEQLRRTMVADVAHELRTPLTNLRGYLEALRDGVAEPAPAVLASLYDEAILLSQLVDDLQDLALSDAGQLALNREVTDADELVASAVRAVQPEAARHGITLSYRGPDASQSVLADVRRVGQVLRNLLANALAYTSAGGDVTVTAVARERDLEVRVADTGSGIPAEHLPYVFERFYRVDSSRARATGGAGIGLAIVKQLVEAHGGRVTVRSTTGVGTTFSFTLPTAA
jgi:signal transduction histidine kinase